MPAKRKISELDTSEVVHPSRQAQVPGSVAKPPAKKPRRTEPTPYKKQAHASSVNAIKKRLRDVTRRLARAEELPATVRTEDERALEAYQQELSAAEAEKRNQKMITKYHMVRFFEKKKADKALKRLRKRLLETESTEEVEALKTEMHIREVDSNYAKYHPLGEIYISLYPKGAEDDETTGEQRAKPPMWKEVEKCMEEGTLDRLRNRRAPGGAVVLRKPVERKLKPVKPRAEAVKVKKAPEVDMTGLNRRQRRQAVGISEKKVMKNKAGGFAGSQASVEERGPKVDDGDDKGDGGFFDF